MTRPRTTSRLPRFDRLPEQPEPETWRSAHDPEPRPEVDLAAERAAVERAQG